MISGDELKKAADAMKKAAGSRANEIRKRAGFKSAEAASGALDVSSNSIYEVERGENWISPEMLCRMALAYKSAPAEFFPSEIKEDQDEGRQRLFSFIRRAKPHQIETLLDLVEGFERRARRQADDGSEASG